MLDKRTRIIGKNYVSKVRAELIRGHGFTEKEANQIIKKSKLKKMIRLFPQEQLHYSIEDTVREILS